MNKVVENIKEALSDIEDGATMAIGGFFAAGVPRVLLMELVKKGVKDLTLACGAGPLLGALNELNALVANKQIKKVIDSYGLFRSASKGAQHMRSDEIDNLRTVVAELSLIQIGNGPGDEIFDVANIIRG